VRAALGRPVAVLALSAGLLGAGGLLAGGRDAAPAPVAAPASVDVTAAVAGADLPAAVRALQARVDRLPGDWSAWASLGALHLQQAVTTADPSYYGRAEAAFARSLEVRPEGNDAALTGQAALAASRHDFVRARELAEQAVAVNAFSAPAHGVLTDALVELGEDEAALQALQRMLDLRPGVPSYTRASYSFELRGDVVRAREALESALRIAVDPADAAFAHRYLGELAFSQGDLDEAGRQFAAGLERAPDAAPLLAGRARVAAARGDVEAALRDWEQVVQRLPEPGYVAELGDLYASVGRMRDAQAQYAVARDIARLFADAGADLDLEQALFAADHGDPAGALAAAERIWQTQRSVHAADAYAWALHVNGRTAQAREVAAQAQRLGTRSALFDYHRGMIELADGDREAARRSLTSALRTPHFSVLHAPRARAALEQLGGPLPG
jgi:tetratricopeptide (TPR) repeat protein